MLFITIIIKYILCDIHCMLNYCVAFVWWFVVLMHKHGIQLPLQKQKHTHNLLNGYCAERFHLLLKLWICHTVYIGNWHVAMLDIMSIGSKWNRMKRDRVIVKCSSWPWLCLISIIFETIKGNCPLTVPIVVLYYENVSLYKFHIMRCMIIWRKLWGILQS